MSFNLTLESIYKEYNLDKIKVPALSAIHLKFFHSEFVAIVGPSGSGKTTLLNLIGGIDFPTSGKVLLNDIDLAKINDNQLTELRNKTIGFIFQNFNLIPILSAYENIEYPLLMNTNIPRNERKERVEFLLESVDLTKYKNHKPNQLSGGQKQRVAIARALVINPGIVLADEPTANLDSKTGEDIIDLMLQMHVKTKCTFIFSTHDPKIMKHAKRIIEIEDGRIK